jgi:tRNA dimethylallyltransferase
LVVGILGPTAVGKTAVAAALARRMGTRIISCDSMQVYEGFPVLTNQPQGPDDAVDLHELVGFVDPARSFSAGEYAALARGLVDREIRSRGKALVVGGSGLYMRAALAPLAARKAGDPGLRELLARRARRQGIDLLYAELATLEPEAARRLDARNERRVLRALEVVLAGNGPWSGRSDLWAPVYDHPTLVVGMVMDKAVLGRRIVTRARRIVEEGAVEEVRRFREERGYECTVPGSPGICSAIGYSESALLAKREIDGATAVEQIAAATRGYARRQLTWLRKVRGAVMIDVRERRPDELAEEILAIADSHAARGERRLS